jgi:hypothetical protein
MIKSFKVLFLAITLGTAGIVYAATNVDSATKNSTDKPTCCALTGGDKGCCKEGSECKPDGSCCVEGSSCCATDCCKAGASCCASDGGGCKADASCCSDHACCSAEKSTKAKAKPGSSKST